MKKTISVLKVESVLPIYNYDLNENKLFSRENEEKIVISEREDVFGEELYKREKNLIEKEAEANQEEDFTPDWVKERVRLGAFGEKIALKYLQKKFSREIISVSNQGYKGYDLEWNQVNGILGYEVKTSKNRIGFHITLNELKKAKAMRGNYHIFFINMDQKKKSEGFIISDPLMKLEIPFEAMTDLLTLENIFVQPSQFFIKFKEGFLDELEFIDLTKYL